MADRWPASRSHHEAVDGSESHRVRNAAAVPHRAQAGAVAEMREDDSSACEVGRQFAQARRKKLVGTAMKPVAPNARVSKPPRQSKCVGQIRLTGTKRRVETRDLRYLRRPIQDCANGSEIVRLVKRRQRRELHEVVEHIRRYPRGTIVVEAAMDYAVTETNYSRSLQERAPHREDVTCSGVVVVSLAREPAIFDDAAIGVPDRKMRREADTLDLPLEESDLLRRIIDRELDARRPGVDHRNAARHSEFSRIEIADLGRTRHGPWRARQELSNTRLSPRMLHWNARPKKAMAAHEETARAATKTRVRCGTRCSKRRLVSISRWRAHWLQPARDWRRCWP